MRTQTLVRNGRMCRRKPREAPQRGSSMITPTPRSPGYQKYVLRWDERPGAGPAEYEAAQTRVLDVFRQWNTPDGFTFHSFVVRVGDWGGYAVIETDNLAHVHVLTTAMAAFTFRLEPV